jgi:hypothetical protein
MRQPRRTCWQCDRTCHSCSTWSRACDPRDPRHGCHRHARGSTRTRGTRAKYGPPCRSCSRCDQGHRCCRSLRRREPASSGCSRAPNGPSRCTCSRFCPSCCCCCARLCLSARDDHHHHHHHHCWCSPTAPGCSRGPCVRSRCTCSRCGSRPGCNHVTSDPTGRSCSTSLPTACSRLGKLAQEFIFRTIFPEEFL